MIDLIVNKGYSPAEADRAVKGNWSAWNSLKKKGKRKLSKNIL